MRAALRRISHLTIDSVRDVGHIVDPILLAAAPGLKSLVLRTDDADDAARASGRLSLQAVFGMSSLEHLELDWVYTNTLLDAFAAAKNPTPPWQLRRAKVVGGGYADLSNYADLLASSAPTSADSPSPARTAACRLVTRPSSRLPSPP